MDAREITEALNQPIFKGESPPRESLFEELDDEQAPLFSKKTLSEPGRLFLSDVAQLIDLFEHGKTFGSLIQVPETLTGKLSAIRERVEGVLVHGDMLDKMAAKSLAPFVQQAQLLAAQHVAVVTNPPYMGKKFYNPRLKAFVHKQYPTTKSDLYAAFIERNLASALPTGCLGMITIPNWLFLSGFSRFRDTLLSSHTIHSLIHNGRGV